MNLQSFIVTQSTNQNDELAVQRWAGITNLRTDMLVIAAASGACDLCQNTPTAATPGAVVRQIILIFLTFVNYSAPALYLFHLLQYGV